MSVKQKKNNLLLEIMEAFNLKNVRNFTLRAGVDEIATITINFYPEESDINSLKTILKNYDLVIRKHD